MRWGIKTISAPTSDTGMVLGLNFEGVSSKSYMINCAENTLRSSIERRFPLVRVGAVFLSSLDIATIGGLPGVMMTLADHGLRDLTVVGPAGLRRYLASTDIYARRSAFSVHAVEVEAPRAGAEASPSPPVEVFKSGDLTMYAYSLQRKDPLTETGLASQIASPMIYLGIGPEVRGKFDAQLATEYGVLNRDRSKLTRGESVEATGKDGQTRMVTPDMIIGPSSPSTALLVIDCPSPDFIGSATGSPMISFLKERKGLTPRLATVFHKVTPGVLSDIAYRAWMTAMGPEVQHIVVDESFNRNQVSFNAIGLIQLQMSLLDPMMFPSPQEHPAAMDPINSYIDLPPQTTILSHRYECHLYPLEPSKTYDRSEDDILGNYLKYQKSSKADREAALDTDQITEGVESISHLLPDCVMEPFRIAKATVVSTASARPSRPGDEVTITTLGTGSAMPSKYRNVLSNLVHVPDQGYILLDAGEGTWGQIARRLGHKPPTALGRSDESPAEAVLRDLRCIYISHLHADHHMGLPSLLSRRRRLDPSPTMPLYLICGRSVYEYLKLYQNIEDMGLDDPDAVRVIQCIDICAFPKEESIAFENPRSLNPHALKERQTNSLQYTAELEELLGLESIKTASVDHRGSCFGISLRHQEGWSITFSGDTTPCKNLIKLGKNSTVLIHEASMGEDEKELALQKNHSTVNDALQVAKQMNVEHVLLTHFSQRYSKMPSIPEEALSQESGPNIAVAFDGASMKIGDMWKFKHYIPALTKLLGESNDIVDDDIEALRSDVAVLGEEANPAKEQGKIPKAKRQEVDPMPSPKKRKIS